MAAASACLTPGRAQADVDPERVQAEVDKLLPHSYMYIVAGVQEEITKIYICAQVRFASEHEAQISFNKADLRFGISPDIDPKDLEKIYMGYGFGYRNDKKCSDKVYERMCKIWEERSKAIKDVRVTFDSENTYQESFLKEAINPIIKHCFPNSTSFTIRYG